MYPDPTKHNPDPAYLRGLIDRAGLSQREAARRIGISDRLMRRYLADRHASTAQDAPYSIQFALESLCMHSNDREKNATADSKPRRDA